MRMSQHPKLWQASVLQNNICLFFLDQAYSIVPRFLETEAFRDKCFTILLCFRDNTTNNTGNSEGRKTSFQITTARCK